MNPSQIVSMVNECLNLDNQLLSVLKKFNSEQSPLAAQAADDEKQEEGESDDERESLSSQLTLLFEWGSVDVNAGDSVYQILLKAVTQNPDLDKVIKRIDRAMDQALLENDSEKLSCLLCFGPELLSKYNRQLIQQLLVRLATPGVSAETLFAELMRHAVLKAGVLVRNEKLEFDASSAALVIYDDSSPSSSAVVSNPELYSLLSSADSVGKSFLALIQYAISDLGYTMWGDLIAEIEKHFWKAVDDDDRETLKHLSYLGPEVFAFTRDGLSAMSFAAKEGDIELLSLLQGLGANLGARDEERGFAPIHYAAAEGHLDVVEYCLQQGVDSNLTILPKEYVTSHFGDRAQLVMDNVEVRHFEDFVGAHPLHLALMNGHTLVVEALVDASANLNATTYNRQTALHFACINGQVDAVQWFLSTYGVMFDEAYFKAGLTDGEIHGYMHPGVSKAYATATIARRQAQTGRVDPCVEDIDEYQALHLALQSGKFSEIKSIFDAFNIDVDLKRLFFAAIHQGDIVQVRELLNNPELGITGEETNKKGMSPLFFALQCGQYEIFKFLLTSGMQCYQYNEKQDLHIIHRLIEIGNLELLELFLGRYTFAFEAETKGRGNVILMAAKQGRFDVLKFLESHISRIKAMDPATADQLRQEILTRDATAFRALCEARGKSEEEALDCEVPIDDRAQLGEHLPDDVSSESGSIAAGGVEDDELDVETSSGSEIGKLTFSELLQRPNKSGMTPLMYAASYGNLEVVQWLASKGVPLMPSDSLAFDKSQTPLGCAISSGRLEVVEYFFENAEIESLEEWLDFAIKCRKINIAFFILKAGTTDSGIPELSSYFSCDSGQGFDLAMMAIEEDDPKILSALRWQVDENRIMDLAAAAVGCANYECFMAIHGWGINCCWKDDRDHTLLLLAINRYFEAVQSCEKDAIENMQRILSAFVAALPDGQINVCHSPFISKFDGLRVSKRYDLVSPLAFAMWRYLEFVSASPDSLGLKTKILDPRISWLFDLFLDNGANINWRRQEDGASFIVMAGFYYCAPVVLYCLDRGIDSAAYMNASGQSPIFAAAYSGFSDMLAIICERQEMRNLLETPAQDFGTPMNTALLLGHFHVVLTLMDLGVNHDQAFDARGLLPFHYAVFACDHNVVLDAEEKFSHATGVYSREPTVDSLVAYSQCKQAALAAKRRYDSARRSLPMFLSAGVDPLVRIRGGHSAFEYLFPGSDAAEQILLAAVGKQISEVLDYAKAGDFQKVRSLLEQYSIPAKYFIDSEGNSLLHWAVIHENYQAAIFLKVHAPDLVALKNNDGSVPFDLIPEGDEHDELRELLDPASLKGDADDSSQFSSSLSSSDDGGGMEPGISVSSSDDEAGEEEKKDTDPQVDQSCVSTGSSDPSAGRQRHFNVPKSVRLSAFFDTRKLAPVRQGGPRSQRPGCRRSVPNA